MSGTIFRPAVETVVTKWPCPAAGTPACAAAMPYKHAAEVDVDHRRPAVDVAVGHRPDLADSGVADQHVEPPELSTAAPTSRSRSSRRRDVDVSGHHFGTAGAQFARDRLQPVGPAAPRTTLAPRAASRRAVASPMPLLAPVMATTVSGVMSTMTITTHVLVAPIPDGRPAPPRH